MAVPAKNGEIWFFFPIVPYIDKVSRAQVLFCSMVSGFDNVHIRANLPRLEQAVKYGNSAGDR